MTRGAHRFRFFVTAQCSPGAEVHLSAEDAAHARVLRLEPNDAIEIVDTAGQVWDARYGEHDSFVVLDGLAHVQSRSAPDIELIAGALTGNRFDELVDGAVQAGATRIVPLVASASDHDRLTQRRVRLERIAIAAAKQSKQTRIATVAEPIDADALLRLPPGIVLDAAAVSPLTEIELGADAPVRLLIGPADGLDPVLVSRLVDAGWHLARLGPSILRAELAAAVAVAMVSVRLFNSG